MNKPKEINNVTDVVADPGTFVFQYNDVQLFSQNYKLDSHVLGEGKRSNLQ